MPIKSYIIPLLLLLLLIITSCGKVQDEPTMPNSNSTEAPNILLIIADDMGKDATAGFSEGAVKPITPNIDQIRDNGLSFNNFWSSPTCSPTRGTMVTGKYAFRTGVEWPGDVLSENEISLQEYIKQESDFEYETAVIGKWHLSGSSPGTDPEALFDLGHFSGILNGGVNDFYSWNLHEDGTTTQIDEYMTTVLTDLAIDWLDQQSSPWFLWMAHTAPHTPFHVPPIAMHQQGDLPPYTQNSDPTPYLMAAIEALDYETGRLIESIPQEELDNTVIIFMGDNGTSGQAAQQPYSRNFAKGSVYQGGVNVPLYVSGNGVTRTGEDDNLIVSTDLFSTIAELAGVDIAEIHDSKSFRSLLDSESTIRNYQYTEMNNPDRNLDLAAISNGQFKLIVNENGDDEMYNLTDDPYESNNLLTESLSTAQQTAKDDLEAELIRIRN